MIGPDDVTAGGGRTILNNRNWGPCAEDATAKVPIGEDVGTEVEMGRVVVIRPNLVQSHVKVGLAKKAK